MYALYESCLHACRQSTGTVWPGPGSPMRPMTAPSQHADGQGGPGGDGLQEESILIFPDNTRQTWDD